MKQEALWRDSETFVLTSVEMFNWGGFQRLHRAPIDGAGTAVIGPTGSGKTTLVDALMTLICASPRYNLASTGGHDSDRDLASYVRGVTGPGDGSAGQSHIARSGKTVTGISATLHRESGMVRLGALLWFEGTSSSAADMKKLWIFSTSSDHTLEHWLSVQHEGGMAALNKMGSSEAGIWTYQSKKQYLARLRDFFEVGENAFNLLNRASGLKQLNSIDEIFRELVLDDRAAFDRAAEVADSFDDLTEIHRELDVARRQQRTLEPIAELWSRYQSLESQASEKAALERLVPVWYAEQGHRLWLAETERLRLESRQAEVEVASAHELLEAQRQRTDELRQLYLLKGGTNIDQLRARVNDWSKIASKRAFDSKQYQSLARNLGLSDELDLLVLQENQATAESRLVVLRSDLEQAKLTSFQLGVAESEQSNLLARLKTERQEVERRPSSNLRPDFQSLRSDLAAELGLDDSALPFVAELVQVKSEEHRWRGAIERAIGGHRLRILVPPQSIEHALRWINNRHNRLHVRLLEVKRPESPAVFMPDGFTRKLTYKDHPYREALKALLAENDRHCVDSPEVLRSTPHAMTAEGLMSGKARFYDKQDQLRLEDDWLTGFDNRDRLAQLASRIQEVSGRQVLAAQELKNALAAVSLLESQIRAFEQISHVDFADIDLPGAQKQLDELNQGIQELFRPDTDLAAAKQVADQAAELVGTLDKQHQQAIAKKALVDTRFEHAATSTRKAFSRSEVGMSDQERELAIRYFPEVAPKYLAEIGELELQFTRSLQGEISGLKDRLSKLQTELAKKMSDAMKEDTGALVDAGRELEDVHKYLDRLRVLTEEALPEKLKRFRDYLNRSSDDGVTQLLSYIEQQVALIEERLDDLNSTMCRVDFQAGRYLRLIANKVSHDSIRALQRAQRALNSARFIEDEGESHYKALRELVDILREACERNRTQAARTLLDPRFRLEFAVSVIDRDTGNTVETRTGSQGGSGGEKEIIASHVLTASLSYALCPDGSSRPLFGSIILDEAFSRSSHAVAARIIGALREFGLHAIFITPNKEMRLLRHHTRSAIVVHRRGMDSSLVSLSWEALDEHYQQRMKVQSEATT
ncbi:ATP-binding protein [Pseudomonas sp.]|uniref:ATP-binding protein n=1 Tax=Pseudomonas sp. TaxID=306 RepID=UPI002915AFBF|nr:SbcC/MukB-like Walker B domain-containing protein [Pseudomonas sp.]MDU4254680.1 SbcC/MukB-like Walker B domain-containing protein [Pseudomonas sp.]